MFSLSLNSGSSHGDREREIQVKFSDKKVKSFLVNEKKTVREIALEIGRKLGIKNTDEFSLQLQPKIAQSPSSPSSSPPTNYYSPFPFTHDDDCPYDGRMFYSFVLVF